MVSYSPHTITMTLTPAQRRISAWIVLSLALAVWRLTVVPSEQVKPDSASGLCQG